MKWLLWTSFAGVKFGLPGYVLHRFHTNFALVNFWADLNFKALKDRMWRSFLRLPARCKGESSLRRATNTDTSKWGTHRKCQETKVQFKYNTRSPANTEKQVCASISIKVCTFRISCDVMVFLSICYLLCYYTIRLYSLLKHKTNKCFWHRRWSCWFYRFTYKYSQRICAFISKLYLVIKANLWGFQTKENNASLVCSVG